MTKTSIKGADISNKKGITEAILAFLEELLSLEDFDAVLIPMRVPSEDSYAWVLVNDENLLGDADPVAPVMPVQGANALSSCSRKGEGNIRIAALMRPCEVRAAIELSKLNQVKLDTVTLITYDCPGALPLSDYIKDPVKGEKTFDSVLAGPGRDVESVKQVCRICDDFSMLPASDLHFAFYSESGGNILLIPGSKKGSALLKKMDIEPSVDISSWKENIEELKKEQIKRRKERFKKVKGMVEGFESLAETFADCIGCHNCQSVCPVCYCRQCYFDSETSRLDAESVLLRTESRGAVSLPADRVMFHIGRMSHMSLSCVSCGLCTDACPVSIPVADLFSYVADRTQDTFNYRSGKDKEEPVPLKTYREEEEKGINELVKGAEG